MPGSLSLAEAHTSCLHRTLVCKRVFPHIEAYILFLCEIRQEPYTNRATTHNSQAGIQFTHKLVHIHSLSTHKLVLHSGCFRSIRSLRSVSEEHKRNTTKQELKTKDFISSVFFNTIDLLVIDDSQDEVRGRTTKSKQEQDTKSEL